MPFLRWFGQCAGWHGGEGEIDRIDGEEVVRVVLSTGHIDRLGRPPFGLRHVEVGESLVDDHPDGGCETCECRPVDPAVTGEKNAAVCGKTHKNAPLIVE